MPWGKCPPPSTRRVDWTQVTASPAGTQDVRVPLTNLARHHTSYVPNGEHDTGAATAFAGQ